ncbi:MAG TPA: pyrimidine-nucleoside phosphorylase, partial [bacterium]|nr:pyrimidine-nucleoside phosphorylase [bacterium]
SGPPASSIAITSNPSMRAYEILQKKRDGGELSGKEIEGFVQGFLSGEIPDYQVSAFLMAVYFRGMTAEETTALTLAMVRSGETLDLSAIRGTKVDKHSTGGVGDKTSLVLIPLVAAAGAPVAKLSGRGLGHTGGTLDKLESIPGFTTELSAEAFVSQVNTIGCAIAGQTADLVPADKKLYALRDVTATVDSIPLIAASVMSKKIAAGSDGIVLDVKTGSGAFMKSLDGSRELAKTMVAIGNEAGRRTVAVISDMDQPLGYAVGNALEVREAIETLAGEGPDDLRELCVALGAQMLVLAGITRSLEDAGAILERLLSDGRALDKFKEMIRAQRGDPACVDDPERLPQAPMSLPVPAPSAGVVTGIDAERIGLAAMRLGAGRAKKEDTIDPAVGIVLKKKVRDQVSKGEALAQIQAAHKDWAEQALALIQAAYSIGRTPPRTRPLIHEIVT